MVQQTYVGLVSRSIVQQKYYPATNAKILTLQPPKYSCIFLEAEQRFYTSDTFFEISGKLTHPISRAEGKDLSPTSGDAAAPEQSKEHVQLQYLYGLC